MRLGPPPASDRLPHYYPDPYWHTPGEDTASQLEELYRRVVLWDHVRFVVKAVRDAGEPGPILDVGCGGGLLPLLLRERGLPAVGLDFSLPAASVAWSSRGVPAVCGTLSNSPFAPESCAVVTMFHVLEHLYDPAAYVEAARKLLRPGGRLIVQVPNAASWQFLLLGDAWNGLDVPRHIFDFRATDIDLLLESCGFTIERRKHFSLRDNPAGLATSLAPGLDPMARRVRGGAESPRVRLLKDFAYFALVVASLPFTMAEAACRAGSTYMVEARKKA